MSAQTTQPPNSTPQPEPQQPPASEPPPSPNDATHPEVPLCLDPADTQNCIRAIALIEQITVTFLQRVSEDLRAQPTDTTFSEADILEDPNVAQPPPARPEPCRGAVHRATSTPTSSVSVPDGPCESVPHRSHRSYRSRPSHSSHLPTPPQSPAIPRSLNRSSFSLPALSLTIQRCVSTRRRIIALQITQLRLEKLQAELANSATHSNYNSIAPSNSENPWDDPNIDCDPNATIPMTRFEAAVGVYKLSGVLNEKEEAELLDELQIAIEYSPSGEPTYIDLAPPTPNLEPDSDPPPENHPP